MKPPFFSSLINQEEINWKELSFLIAMTFAWKTQSTFFFPFLILFLQRKIRWPLYWPSHAGGKNSLAIFHHHFRRKFRHTHTEKVATADLWLIIEEMRMEPIFCWFYSSQKIKCLECVISPNVPPLVQTNLTQIDDSCRRNCWWEKKKKKNFQNFAIFAEIIIIFFCFFFPQMECLINSSGGPPVGDNNAGGSDLEHVSVHCCCCWYLLGCPLPRNPIIVFILHLLKKPRIYFRHFHTHTRNGSITSLHIGHDVLSARIEDFIDALVWIDLMQQGGKKKIQMWLANDKLMCLPSSAHSVYIDWQVSFLFRQFYCALYSTLIANGSYFSQII